MRERGLKSFESGVIVIKHWSLPVRERGFKLVGLMRLRGEHAVAPRAGAWIEMYLARVSFVSDGSLPVRERGLK